jgi:hypothetical protein
MGAVPASGIWNRDTRTGTRRPCQARKTECSICPVCLSLHAKCLRASARLNHLNLRPPDNAPNVCVPWHAPRYSLWCPCLAHDLSCLQIDTEIWDAPKCVEQNMCSRLLSLRLVVFCTWIRHKDSVYDYFDYLNFLIYWSCLVQAAHCVHLSPTLQSTFLELLLDVRQQLLFQHGAAFALPIWQEHWSRSINNKVVLTSCKAAVADARLPCDLVTLLLISQQTAKENPGSTFNTVGPS